MSLVIVGGTSALGAFHNIRRGIFNWRAATFFSLSGIPGAVLGARFTHLASPTTLMLFFGGLMLIVGARMLQRAEMVTSGRKCQPARCLAVGLGVGVLTGFLGVGGGFVILPALVFFAALEMKVAIGTSLAIIAVNCVGGLIGQLGYAGFSWRLTLGFLAAAMVGMGAGLALSNRIASRLLGRAFAWTVIALGAFLLIKNLLRSVL
jgi:uncharacterized membrane protein YfcA